MVGTRLISGRRLIATLSLLVPIAMIASTFAGTTLISPLSLLSGEAPPQIVSIVTAIRIPRMLMAAMVGAVLATSGALLQGLFRNPLADPSLIGVSAGASVGASITILMGLGAISAYGFTRLSVITFWAFIGGLIAVGIVYRLSTGRHGTSVSTMLLVGIAISAFAGAIGSLLNIIADDAMLRRMSLWQMGNLDLANWPRVSLCALMLAGFCVLLRGQATHLNAFLLGEAEAYHLGLDVNAVKRRLIGAAALGVGVCTALAGNIAFVGLVVPHLVRQLAGPDHNHLLLASGLLGALTLMCADVLARVLLSPAELPVGVVTAFLGVPLFIFLLVRNRDHQHEP